MTTQPRRNDHSPRASRGVVVAVWTVSAALSLWAVYAYNADFARLDQATEEDGLLEYAQAAAFFVGAVGFLVGWVHSRFRNLFALGLGLLLLVVAGEEVSWGQRIFGVDTPESLADVNLQGETTLHNIDGIHQSIRGVALLFIFGLIVALPLLDRWSGWVRSRCAQWKVPVAPLWTIPVTVAASLFMIVPRLDADIVFALDEVGETLVALTFLLYGVVWSWATTRRSQGTRREEVAQSAAIDAVLAGVGPAAEQLEPEPPAGASHGR